MTTMNSVDANLPDDFKLSDIPDIEYNKLSSKRKELVNFHKVAYILSRKGYNSVWLSDDTLDADFLAVPDPSGDAPKTVLPIQLKTRAGTDVKYLNNPNLMIAFPSVSAIDSSVGHRWYEWYLVLHTRLIESFSKNSNGDYLNSKSYKGGSYSAPNLSDNMRMDLEPFRIFNEAWHGPRP